MDAAFHSGSERLGLNPSRAFIRRPVATTLLMLAILVAGLVAYRFLPLSALPEVDYPTIQVTTLYPGASPNVVSATITSPLERQLGQMAGLSRMTSASAAGASSITLQFGLDVTLDVAEQEVQAALNAAGSLLPSDLPSPPVYAKVNPADAPILSLGVTSPTRPLEQVQHLVATRVANRLSQVSGVGLVSLTAGQRPAVRIQANIQSLAALGLSTEHLRTAIAAANINGAKGSFDGSTRSWSINSNDQLTSPEEYGALIIAYRHNAPVRLRDVAQVADGAEDTRVGAWMNGKPAIVVDVQRQPGANVIGTVDALMAVLPTLSQALPEDVHLQVLSDRTMGIRASVHDVQIELIFAVALVTLAIFLFLGNLRATLVASVAVPLSLVGGFGAMHLLDYSLNNLTLMAMTIASGFVVDDAIVVLENIARHIEDGQSPLQAAFTGSREIGFTIISLTLSLVAVLIPLLFMGDVVGRLFREFAVTLTATILLSAVVSLTLVPMLSARWLKMAPAPIPTTRLAHGRRKWFDGLSDGYRSALDWVLARQRGTLVVVALTSLATCALSVGIPKGLFPIQDTGQLQAVVMSEQGTSFERAVQIQGLVADALLADPDVASLSSNVGVDGKNLTLNSVRMLINLKAKRERSSQYDIIARLRQRVQALAGATLYVRPVEDLTIDVEAGPTQYRLSLQGADPAVVATWAQRLMSKLASSQAVVNLVSDIHAQGNSVTVLLDRDTAARFGISAAAVDNALYDAFGQRIVSTIFTDSAQYRVILEAQPDMVASPDSLQRLYVTGADGLAVPLGAIATVRTGQAPLLISRVGQFPAATIGFDLASGVSLGDAVTAISAAEAELGMPSALTTRFLGAAGAFRASLANQVWLLVAAVVCVYIVLGVLYESFVHPLTILSTLPSAGVGALLALWLTGNELGVIGIIGLVLLIGIVKKNAIMMIDFAIDARREHRSNALEAIREAAVLRFRPIMMTTFAALFAALPLIFGSGMGSELRLPLGLAVAGGLIVSQGMTLFTTPVIYLALERLAHRIRQRGPRALRV